MMRLEEFAGGDGVASCTTCEDTFEFSASHDSDDPSVGWIGGWSFDLALPQLARHLHACTGRRLLDESEAQAVAMAGGLAAVADCVAVLSEDQLADDLDHYCAEQRADAILAQREAAAFDDHWS